jgi:hypothetical protein
MMDEQGQMANLSQQSSRENAGTTNLGALLKAKLEKKVPRDRTCHCGPAQTGLVLCPQLTRWLAQCRMTASDP